MAAAFLKIRISGYEFILGSPFAGQIDIDQLRRFWISVSPLMSGRLPIPASVLTVGSKAGVGGINPLMRWA
jgi:hypothetical protein